MATESEPNVSIPATTPKRGFYSKIFYHPNFNVWIGIVGTLLGCFGVYSYFASIKEPNLTYTISPTRTAIVQKGSLTNFSVIYQGLAVTNDLSSAELFFWNQGKQSIRGKDISLGGNIVKHISISTPNGEPIFTVSENSSRPEIGYTWKQNIDRMGVFEFDWKILEQGDAIRIQIIYGGGVNLPIIVDGAIEGQKTLTRYDGTTMSKFKLTAMLIWLAIAGIALAVIQNNIEKMDLKKTKRARVVFLIVHIVALIIVLVSSYFMITYFKKPASLPF